MKKILALAAMAALTAGVSAYAANPFSDVTPDDWAYQAVSDLSDQGVVEGYPDGTFKGERNMTRYELAQIIARLMAKEDQLNAEQRATLDKLAGEYADELANLGVRVSNLEKKVGNIAWSGNARMRYVQSYKDDGSGDAKDKWDGRMKIIAKAQVNDSTTVTGRLRYDMNFKGADSNDGHVWMEELKATHQFGDNLSVTLGRQDLFLGQTGTEFDDEFDGAIATAALGKVNVDLGYGRLYGGLLGKPSVEGKSIKNDTEMFLGRVYGDAGRISYDVEYLDGKDSLDARLFGAGLTARLGGDFSVFGDYYKNTEYKGDPYTWTAGLGYGHADWKKPGTWDLSAQYLHAEKGSFIDDATYNVTPASIVDSNGGEASVAKYWLAQGDVILQKNVKLHAEYAFDVKADNDIDYDDLWTVSLNYIF